MQVNGTKRTVETVLVDIDPADVVKKLKSNYTERLTGVRAGSYIQHDKNIWVYEEYLGTSPHGEDFTNLHYQREAKADEIKMMKAIDLVLGLTRGKK